MKRLCAAGLALVLLVLALPALGQARVFNPPNELERRRQALYGFLDTAFTPEYAGDDRDFLLRWTEPIRASIAGAYTPEEEAFFEAFLDQLNQAGLQTFPGIMRVAPEYDPNMVITYCPLAEMGNYVQGYVPGNWGMFYYYYENWALVHANIAIATDVTTLEDRQHLLLEEIVGALGLTNDIYTYSDSIVYQPWTTMQQLSDLDWLMLGYLYSDKLTLGMNAVEAYGRLLPGLTQ